MSKKTKEDVWEEKLAVGNAAEKVLDEFLSNQFDDIAPVNMEWQKRGVDRWAIKDGYWIPIEYKADFAAARTGNAFIETVKNCNSNAPGWAKTTMAQILYYYVPPTGMIYPLYPVTWKLDEDKNEDFKSAKCKINDTYDSEGLLVPLHQITILYGHAEAMIYRSFQTEAELIKYAETIK